jgi:hypothetical protein
MASTTTPCRHLGPWKIAVFLPRFEPMATVGTGNAGWQKRRYLRMHSKHARTRRTVRAVMLQSAGARGDRECAAADDRRRPAALDCHRPRACRVVVVRDRRGGAQRALLAGARKAAEKGARLPPRACGRRGQARRPSSTRCDCRAGVSGARRGSGT